MSGERLPRPLHPGAWWAWALCLATAASRTTNPALLLLIGAVVAHVVSVRKADAPWAAGFHVYVVLSLVVIAIRIVFRMLLDAQHGAHVLFTLPEVPLPEAARGIRIGGDVSLEGLLAALYDGLRLAVLLVCVGAANVLANPKRLLKAMPAALHEIGVAVTVGLSVAPQLVESGQRVRRARRLRRGSGRRRNVLREIAIPVMTDALDRSLLLAAAMDARGYGRRADLTDRQRARNGALLLTGLVGLCIGAYGLLDSTAPRYLGLVMLAIGGTVGATGIALSGRSVPRTRYRPDPWLWAEWTVAGSGVVVAVVLVAASAVDPADLYPSLSPLSWPALPLVPALAIAVGALPAWLAPPVRATGGTAVEVRRSTRPAEVVS